jgi:transcriptional regulator with XRE-family HTH domain
MIDFKTNVKIQNEKMATHLKTLRQNGGFTMRSLAEQIGTPHSFIGKIEQQSRRLDVGEFTLYCRSLGRDPVEVFKQVVNL